MLTDDTQRDIATALVGLRDRSNGPWAALGPLSKVSASDTDLSIDFSTEAILGFPVIIARARPRQLSVLTNRQTMVCDALARGLSNKAIARKLNISPATVKDHEHAILKRLNLKSRAEIIAHVHGV